MDIKNLTKSLKGNIAAASAGSPQKVSKEESTTEQIVESIQAEPKETSEEKSPLPVDTKIQANDDADQEEKAIAEVELRPLVENKGKSTPIDQPSGKESKTFAASVVTEKGEGHANTKAPKKKQKNSVISQELEALLTEIREFKREEDDGQMMRVDRKTAMFLTKARIATRIPASQLLNYILTSYLKKNPELIEYIDKVMGETQL